MIHLLYVAIVLISTISHSMDHNWEHVVFNAWIKEHPHDVAIRMAGSEPTITVQTSFLNHVMGAPVALATHNQVLYSKLMSYLSKNTLNPDLSGDIKLTEHTSFWVSPLIDGANRYSFTAHCDKNSVASLVEHGEQ